MRYGFDGGIAYNRAFSGGGVKKMPVRGKLIKIGLYRGPDLVGVCVFSSLAVEEPGGYACEPPGVLSREQVRELTRQLGKVPAASSGTVNGYTWKVE